MASSRAVRYGNPGFDTSAVVTVSRTSRARGPKSPMHAYAPVTSTRWAEPSRGRWRAIQPRSWVPKALPVTMRKRSVASRVTVKSHSIPPRALSMDV